MKRAYLGIDMGSVSTKGVIIDEDNNIIASTYFYNNENVIDNLKIVIKDLKKKIDLNNYKVVGVGTTGSKRKLIGTILETKTIKNEISAHAIGTISIHPDVRTIIEMGGEEIKIISINKQKIVCYETNNLYNLGIKSLISKEKDYKKINDIFKDKMFEEPIVFEGGASQNNEIVDIFKGVINKPIIVDHNAYLMGAFGVALLSKKEEEKEFSFDLEEISFDIKTEECSFCFNNCDIVKVFRNNKVIDIWGGKCPKNELIHKY